MPDDDPQYWLDLSDSIMSFIRRRDLICAPERLVWLFKANALDQLAAFLQNRAEDPDHGLCRNRETE